MLTGNGKAFGGIVVADPTLQDSVEKVIKKVKMVGSVELEFVKGRHGHELIEMNPRFPSWCQFSVPDSDVISRLCWLTCCSRARSLPPLIVKRDDCRSSLC